MAWTKGLVNQLPSQVNHLSMWKDMRGLMFIYFALFTARVEVRPSYIVSKCSSIELHHQLSCVKQKASV